jgi:hypothetical protein
MIIYQVMFDQMFASSFVDLTVRNLSMLCKGRTGASLSKDDEDTTFETIIG